MYMKVCRKCKKGLSLDQFNRNSKTKDSLQSYCKECMRVARKKSYRKHNVLKKRLDPEAQRQRALENMKHWRQARPNYMREWQQNNPVRLARYQKKQYETNVNYRLGMILRTRLTSALKKNAKVESASVLVGCTLSELKAHLEEQFVEGMSWMNHGEWHIDHIRPCASFDLSDEAQQRECFHYSNLQPLWAEDNFDKADSVYDKLKHGQ